MEDKVYRVKKKDLDNIADAIRYKYNNDNKHTVEGMAEAIRGITTPIPEGYIKPEGELIVNENGSYDAAEYASVAVNVSIPEGYIKPEGTLEITEGGEHDVTPYAKVMVGNIAEDLTDVIAEQEALIEELAEILEGKSNVGSGEVKVTAGGSTPVPEGGFVEKLYFNTDMSIDEVVSFVKSFMIEGENWVEVCPFSYYDDTRAISYGISNTIMTSEITYIMEVKEGSEQSMRFIFVSRELTEEETNSLPEESIPSFVGWNPELVNPIELNLENNDGDFGLDMSWSSLVSITSFEEKQILLSGEYDGSNVNISENGLIDVESMLNEKKLPAFFNVNVPVPMNIHCGLTEPDDTNKIWVKMDDTPFQIKIANKADRYLSIDSTIPSDATLSESENKTCFMAAAAVGTKVYLFGGSEYVSNQVKTRNIYIYDTETDTLTPSSATLPTEASNIAAVAVGTKVYLFGGKDSSGWLRTINIYDTETDTLTPAPATIPTAASDIAAVSVGTKVYLFGGNSRNGYLNTIIEYDTKTDTRVTLSAVLPTAASDIAATAVGTKVYLFGGNSDSGYLRTVNIYDTETNTLTPSSDVLPGTMEQINIAAVVENKILLFSTRSEVYVYDIETDSCYIDYYPGMYTYKAVAAAAIDNRICYFGGANNIMPVQDIYVFDIRLVPSIDSRTLLIETQAGGNKVSIIKNSTIDIEIEIGQVWFKIVNDYDEKSVLLSYAIHDGTQWVDKE